MDEGHALGACVLVVDLGSTGLISSNLLSAC